MDRGTTPSSPGWSRIARRAQVHHPERGLALRAWTADRCLPGLLLVHGGSGSWLHWLPALPALLPRFRVFAVDLPGLGASRGASHADIGEVAAGLRATVTFLGSRLDAVAAFSFGAVVTALAYEGLARPPALHVLAPAGFGPSQLALDQLKRMTGVRSAAERRAVDRHNLAVAMLAPGRPISPRIERLYRCALRETSFDSRAGSFSRIVEAALPRLPLRSALWAGADAFIGADLTRRMALVAQAHPAAAQHVIAGAGHWLAAEEPQAVADWLAVQAR